MLIANFWHIKKTNGLFYYGLDYLKEISVYPRRILVKPQLYNIACDKFPGESIIACGLARFLWEMMQGLLKRIPIYTPTSHPFPFINKQLIVLHDTYPFLGLKGSLKKWLFVISAKSCNCKLSYINKSMGYAFYKKYRFRDERLVFAPNRYSGSVTNYKAHIHESVTKRIVIGLVGTDSPKKNYHRLFNAVQKAGISCFCHFLLYGHQTTYFSQLINDFKNLSIDLVDSDHQSMDYFLGCIDSLVSIAEHEGFGRPIASALESGVPCFLLENPVFEEFYSNGAYFFDNEFKLLQNLFNKWQNGLLHEVHFVPPAHIVNAFEAAAQKIQHDFL